MAMQSRSSHPVLSHTDSMAAGCTDAALLVGRILLGSLFLTAGWGKFTNPAGALGYFKGLQVPSPEIWAWAIPSIELVIAFMLIFGLATRYAAVLSFVFLLLATAIAHRYWGYPPAQQFAQYVQFTKNVGLMSGSVLLFVTGGGRLSVDERLK